MNCIRKILFALGVLINLSAYSAEVEFVIAQYLEDITWLKPYAGQMHVYHKGPLKSPQFPVQNWTILENVGREGHTYLFHIIKNYDSLADITFFLQGHIDDHSHGYAPGHTIPDILKKARECGFAGFGKPHTVGDWSEGYPRWWKELLGVDKPPVIKFHAGACFAVKKELIRKHPKKYYEKILKVLDYSSNPFEGHGVERMWPFIFDPKYATSF